MFAGAPGHQFGQVSIIVLSEEELLLIPQQIFLIVILERKTGRGASRR
jgi:hypothetical protein